MTGQNRVVSTRTSVTKRKSAKTRPTITEAGIKARMDGLGQFDGAVDLVHGWLTEEDIMEQPAPAWRIERWVPRKGVVVLYGEPGIGKTLQLIAWTKHVQRGEPWHGLHVKQGPVLFIEGETLEGFGPRLDAFNAAVKLPEGVVETEVRYVGMPTNLSSPKAIRAVILAGRQLADEAGEPLAMVVIDPLIENMSGDENGDGMDEASRALRIIAEELGCVVVVGHHSNAEGGRERGNQKLRARVHVVVRMEAIDPTTVGLVVQKQRNGERRAMRLSKDAVAESVVLTPYEHVSEQEYEQQKIAVRAAAKARNVEAAAGAKNELARSLVLGVLPTTAEAAIPRRQVKDKAVGNDVGAEHILKVLDALVEAGEVRTEPGRQRGSLRYWRES